jgi:hypothetical protein
MIDLKRALNLRLDIYFAMTLKQKQRFNASYSWHFMENVPMDDFKRITKNKRLHEKMMELKKMHFRLVSDNAA